MYVSPSCCKVQWFFKYYVTEDDVGIHQNMSLKLKHVVIFLKITIKHNIQYTCTCKYVMVQLLCWFLEDLENRKQNEEVIKVILRNC